MDLTRKQAEYWAFIIGLMIAIAIAVLLIDFAIKASILEESNKLRMTIEGVRSGQVPTAANASGANSLHSDDASIPSDVLVVDNSGMEAGNVHNGTQKEAARKTTGRAKPRRPSSSGTIPGGNE